MSILSLTCVLEF